ncbi:MAG: carotenoid biosynthesis protein [Bacteroidota bacterium]
MNITNKNSIQSMELYPKSKLPLGEVRKFIIIFYIVGVLGFLIPFTRDIFIRITPLALLLSVYLLAVYHKSFTPKTLVGFALVYVLGFFIEAIGVNTGLIFGHYRYGSGLGIKLFETPLMIGVNWLFLTYTSLSVVRSMKIKKVLSVFLAPLLMLVYDLILEIVAPKMDMWSWENTAVPLKNYLAWYGIGVAFALIFTVFRINTKNPLSLVLLVCQFVFFIFLAILL